MLDFVARSPAPGLFFSMHPNENRPASGGQTDRSMTISYGGAGHWRRVVPSGYDTLAGNATAVVLGLDCTRFVGRSIYADQFWWPKGVVSVFASGWAVRVFVHLVNRRSRPINHPHYALAGTLGRRRCRLVDRSGNSTSRNQCDRLSRLMR